MNGPNCPVIERDESNVIRDNDIRFINSYRKSEFKFWCREKND